MTYLETAAQFYSEVAETPQIGLCCVQSTPLQLPGLQREKRSTLRGPSTGAWVLYPAGYPGRAGRYPRTGYELVAGGFRVFAGGNFLWCLALVGTQEGSGQAIQWDFAGIGTVAFRSIQP